MAPLPVIHSLHWEEETKVPYTTWYVKVYTVGTGMRNKKERSTTQGTPCNSVVVCNSVFPEHPLQCALWEEPRDEHNDRSLQEASSLVGGGTPFYKYKLSLRPPGPLRLFGTVWPDSWIHSTKSIPDSGMGGGDASGSPVENLMPSCVVILV